MLNEVQTHRYILMKQKPVLAIFSFSTRNNCWNTQTRWTFAHSSSTSEKSKTNQREREKKSEVVRSSKYMAHFECAVEFVILWLWLWSKQTSAHRYFRLIGYIPRIGIILNLCHLILQQYIRSRTQVVWWTNKFPKMCAYLCVCTVRPFF